VLLPYWIALLHNPIKQMPISNRRTASRGWLAVNCFRSLGRVAACFAFHFHQRLQESRLRPPSLGTVPDFALGGTTPLPRMLLGALGGVVNAVTGANVHNPFDILTFERFAFWANLMALPIVGLLAVKLVDRYGRKATFVLGTLAAFTTAMAVSWPVYHPIHDAPFSTAEVVSFQNRDGHDNFHISRWVRQQDVGGRVYANASSVDGEYNSARLLPEMTQYGSAQLTNSNTTGRTALSLCVPC
jgi:hypothetical protein